MAHRTHTSNRVLIIGGGVSGLSIAARLAQSGLPVTVLEASRLGFGASTRNQGWLYSGAWFAREQTDLARACLESLRQTLQFCPECVEPDADPMVYLMSDAATDVSGWIEAWDAAEIPFHGLTGNAVSSRFPGLASAEVRHAFELPDRAIRTDLLLRRLAEAARSAGVEIRPNTPVTELIRDGESVEGVRTGDGESIPARLVILAGNARGGSLFPAYGAEPVGSQRDVALVVLQTHLIAVRPEVSLSPLCVVDADGFNHIPHRPNSVFGLNRWRPVSRADDEKMVPAEIDDIWRHATRFFPELRREKHTVSEWAGNTVQAMHVDQIEPGRVPLPTVIVHGSEQPRVQNLLSVFPGRASLWPHLAEKTCRIVLQELESVEAEVVAPPWGTSDEAAPVANTRSSPGAADNLSVYHCQRCGHIVSREPDLEPPVCCDTEMVYAGAETRRR